MKRYGLRDDQFARIETLLPGRPGTVGRSSELGNRLFVEAVIWKFRSGAPWRDLPERFGDWKNELSPNLGDGRAGQAAAVAG